MQERSWQMFGAFLEISHVYNNIIVMTLFQTDCRVHFTLGGLC